MLLPGRSNTDKTTGLRGDWIILNVAAWKNNQMPDHEGGTAGGASVPVPLPAEGTGGIKRGRYVWAFSQLGAPSHLDAVL